MYLGDFRLADVLYFSFTTRSFTTGAPTTLAGTPVISVYKDDDDTQTTTGVTLSVDDDGITGWNRVKIDLADSFYATATDFHVVITTGTVGGVSVVGEVVALFSIANRSALMPTTAGRTLDVSAAGNAGIDWANIDAPTTAQDLSGTSTKALEPTTAGRKLDVSAGGEAGLDWSNIGSPTTAQNLSSTNIDVDQVVASVSGAVGSVTGAVGSVTGNVGGNVVGSVGSVVADVGITQTGADKVWASAARTLTSFGTLVADVATAVWGAATRILTAGTNIVLAKGVGLTGLNDLSEANVRSAVGLAAANLDAQLAALDSDILTRASPADVNAQVLDVLNVDTFGEPTGVPPATTTLVNKIGRLHAALRNQVDVDSNTGKKQFYTDAGVVAWEKDFTDAGGVYSESEGNAP